jgi:hypothetical protein
MPVFINTIVNPNSCGQGYSSEHSRNPYHTLLTSYGWQYSHSTPVTLLEGKKLYHTYVCGINRDWVASVGNDDLFLEFHKLGNGYRHHMSHMSDVAKYLKRKNSELLRLAAK